MNIHFLAWLVKEPARAGPEKKKRDLDRMVQLGAKPNNVQRVGYTAYVMFGGNETCRICVWWSWRLLINLANHSNWLRHAIAFVFALLIVRWQEPCFLNYKYPVGNLQEEKKSQSRSEDPDPQLI